MLERTGPVHDDSRRKEIAKKLGLPEYTTWVQMRSHIVDENTRKKYAKEFGLPENSTLQQIRNHIFMKVHKK